MINKFLHQNGGSETYMFKLSEYLSKQGFEVQFFGMDHPDRCVGNRIEAYTTNMDFHNGSYMSKFMYPLRVIYSSEARKLLRRVLEDFLPDVIHINNFNYQLTPSILLEIKRWKKKGHRCRVVYTAHDYQLICPNHMCKNPITNKSCELCCTSGFSHCIKNRCIHNSLVRSLLGYMEATLWNRLKVYDNFDAIICISDFVKRMLDMNSLLAKKTVVIKNFVDMEERGSSEKKDYVLYFGRYSAEKGVETLLKACTELKDIPFLFAGGGNLEDTVSKNVCVENLGFLSGDELKKVISEARFSIMPSEWYEGFGLSAAESIVLGTPVIGANIGGIPEVVMDNYNGLLFESGNIKDLESKIKVLWTDRELLRRLTDNCSVSDFNTLETYSDELMKLYHL